MNKYKKVIDQIREKGNGGKKAMEDGAAMLAALYTLCLDDGINTVGAYLEIRGRLDNLLDDMYDKMREIYPVPTRTASEGKSERDIADALERLRAISAKEDRP